MWAVRAQATRKGRAASVTWASVRTTSGEGTRARRNIHQRHAARSHLYTTDSSTPEHASNNLRGSLSHAFITTRCSLSGVTTAAQPPQRSASNLPRIILSQCSLQYTTTDSSILPFLHIPSNLFLDASITIQWRPPRLTVPIRTRLHLPNLSYASQPPARRSIARRSAKSNPLRILGDGDEPTSPSRLDPQLSSMQRQQPHLRDVRGCHS